MYGKVRRSLAKGNLDDIVSTYSRQTHLVLSKDCKARCSEAKVFCAERSRNPKRRWVSLSLLHMKQISMACGAVLQGVNTPFGVLSLYISSVCFFRSSLVRASHNPCL